MKVNTKLSLPRPACPKGRFLQGSFTMKMRWKKFSNRRPMMWKFIEAYE